MRSNGHVFATSAVCTSLWWRPLKAHFYILSEHYRHFRQGCVGFGWDSMQVSRDNTIRIKITILPSLEKDHVFKTSTVWLACTDWTQIREVLCEGSPYLFSLCCSVSSRTFQKAWRVDEGMGCEVGIYGSVTMATTINGAQWYTTSPCVQRCGRTKKSKEQFNTQPKWERGERGEWGGDGWGDPKWTRAQPEISSTGIG